MILPKRQWSSEANIVSSFCKLDLCLLSLNERPVFLQICDAGFLAERADCQPVWKLKYCLYIEKMKKAGESGWPAFKGQQQSQNAFCRTLLENVNMQSNDDVTTYFVMDCLLN